MIKVLKKTTALIMMLCMVIAVASGCSGEKKQTAVTDTIYIGHHYQPEDDPYWVSEITGEPVMDPVKSKASIAALNTVKEQLGVDIKWKQWPSGVTQDCLQTVLAGDPYCHIAILSNGFQGRVMIQNVLQPLDEYMDIFDDPDREWITSGKTFGHYYLLNRDLLYITDWPMVYNATMLEEIPELKEEDGTTLYPCELYERGEWTWSVFEDYLQKIKNYYAGKKADSGADIVPYDARYQYTALQAIHSNGAYLYNGEGMAFDTPEAVEACEYLDRLMTNGLVNCCTASFGKSRNPGYLESVNAFARGEAVFNNCARWKMGSSSTTLAERGESMGIIFFPRPDDVPFKEYNNEVHNDPNYRYNIGISCADSVGLLRGFGKEESRLALEAYALFKVEFYKNYGNVDSIEEYRKTMVETEANSFGIDILHSEIGDKNLAIFELLGSLSENEYGEAMNIIWSYGVDTFGASVYGTDGSPKYAINVEQRKASIYKSIDNIGEALKNKGATDAVNPSAAMIDSSKPIAFSMGTDVKTINWLDYFKASDNVDGEYEMKMENGKIYLKANPNLEGKVDKDAPLKEYEFIEDAMVVDASAIDFDTPGVYEKAIRITTTDTSGNTATNEFNAYVYDEHGKKAPTLKLKEEYGKIDLNADTSAVKWADLFVEEAVDENGINLKSFVSADVSELDVTVKGKYPLTIYVEDFAGNRTEIEIEAEVK